MWLYLEIRPLKRSLRLNEVIRVRPQPQSTNVLVRGRRRTGVCTQAERERAGTDAKADWKRQAQAGQEQSLIAKEELRNENVLRRERSS